MICSLENKAYKERLKQFTLLAWQKKWIQGVKISSPCKVILGGMACLTRNYSQEFEIFFIFGLVKNIYTKY